MTINILIVDDRAVVRAELRNLLELSGDISVVGEACDGLEAVRKAEALRPDIVLMDLEMPNLDGFEATRKIKAQHLSQAVIILTAYGDGYHRQKALEAGADDFIIKGTDLRVILETFEKFSHKHKDYPETPGNI